MSGGVSNEQILTAIMSLKQDMGGVQQVASNAHNFASAVSKKADLIREEVRSVERGLSDHKKEEGAHGVAAERRGWDGARTALISCLSAAAAAIAVLKFLAPLAKAAP
jgi:hypothetical protein